MALPWGGETNDVGIVFQKAVSAAAVSVAQVSPVTSVVCQGIQKVPVVPGQP